MLALVVVAGTAAADTLGDLTFTPPAGWDEKSATKFRRTYTQGSAYISISVGELSTLDLAADTAASVLARSYALDGKVATEADTEVAGAPGYAMLYQAGDGLSLITVTAAGGGTVFQLETTRATQDADLATFARLVDGADLPAPRVKPAEPAPASTVIAATELAKLPDPRARKAAIALAEAVAGDLRKKFVAMTPKKGLTIGKQRFKRTKLARAVAEAGVGALLGWDPEAPFAVVYDQRTKKAFGIYRGSGFGVTAVVMFHKQGKAWSVAKVKVVDFGEP